MHNGKENRAPVIPKRHFYSRRVDNSFQAKHYFNLIKSSLSGEAYDYWNELDLIVNRQGPIFDVPPPGVTGNLLSETGEEVLVFDECSDVTIAEFASVPRGCIQCLIHENIVLAHCFFCNELEGSCPVRPGYF